MDERDKQCPTCKRDDFKNVRGMRQHHAKTHGKSISYEWLNCTSCGKDLKKESMRDTSGNNFCNDSCRGSYYSGENHPLYNKVTVECDWCGDDKEVVKSVAENEQKNFCNREECKREWMKTWDGSSHPAYEGIVKVNCDYCGTTFEEYTYELNRKKHCFCKDDCRNDWKSGFFTSEGNPNWKGWKR